MDREEAMKLLENGTRSCNNIDEQRALDALMREAQPAQELVATVTATVTSETGNLDVTMSWWHEPALPVGTKLYTTPPKREWVGLTDEERNDCLVKADPCECLADPEAFQLMDEVEAVLKGKNT